MKLFIAFAVVCLLLFTFRERWLLLIGDFLIIEDHLQPADVIHVIAGEDYRLDHAIQLYQQGYGKKIFLTGGGWCSHAQMNHSIEWKEKAVGRGVPEEDIVIDEGRIISTYDEVQWLKLWIEQSQAPIRSVIVVSDPFHMRRARWTYQRVLGDSLTVQMSPAPFELTSYERAWWKHPEGRRYVWTEYQKYVYYILRYQLSSGWLKEWLISLDTQ